MILLGYFLIGIAILMSIYLLLQLSFGFRVDKNGKVIQQGVAFFSSEPNPAQIFANGELKNKQTNTRLSLPSGIYDIKLRREGYRDWQRSINLEGGRVAHYDYPLLIPNELKPKNLQPVFDSQPGFMSQSPDKRWLLVEQPGSLTTFQVFDLKNPDKPSTVISIPESIVTNSANSTLEVSEWAGDNEHVVLKHLFDGRSEYILIDRTKPEESVNLNTTLGLSPPQLSLINKKYDLYYLFDPSTQVLQKNSLKEPVPVPVLSRVINFQSYSDDTILYATGSDAPAGKVAIRMKRGDKTYPIRSLPAGSTYLLDLTGYSNKLYVVAGASSDSKTYIYRDPIGQLNERPGSALIPSQVMHVTRPNYLKFSTSAQFIMTQNANEFAVYDFENKIGYHYNTAEVIDAPQTHATWMDGNRLSYVSQGKIVMFDYDYQNVQTLVAASSSYAPAITSNYKFLYALKPSASAPQYDMTQTSLLTPADE